MGGSIELTRVYGGGFKELRAKFSTTNRANGLFSQPSVGTLKMKPVVTTGNHPSRLIPFNIIQTNRAFIPMDELVAGNLRKLLEFGGG